MIHENHFEHVVACMDESGIEATLRRKLAQHFEPHERESHAEWIGLYRRALRYIDELQANGTYEAERQRLRERRVAEFEGLPPPSPKFLEMAAEWKAAEASGEVARIDGLLQRLWDGLSSPDADQRARFEALFATWKDRHLRDPGILETLAVLEPVKRRRARPEGKQYEDEHLLIEMKHLVCAGSCASASAAAAQVAPRAHGGGTEKSRAARLQKAFAAKMALRG